MSKLNPTFLPHQSIEKLGILVKHKIGFEKDSWEIGIRKAGGTIIYVDTGDPKLIIKSYGEFNLVLQEHDASQTAGILFGIYVIHAFSGKTKIEEPIILDDTLSPLIKLEAQVFSNALINTTN
jgi:hypothetical protein